MKKTLRVLFISSISFHAFSQDAIKDLECKGYAEAVAKAVKASENAKSAVKGATWLKLGDAYIDLATRCTSDSSAAQKAYDAYNKGAEVEKAAGGKKSKDFEKALTEKKLGDAFLQQGAAFYNNKNLKMASKFFGMSANINTKDTTAALYSGIVNQSLGDNITAVKSFNKYLDNGGRDVAVFYSLAQALKMDKKYDEAVAVLKKGSSIHPNDKDLKNEVINIYIASNNIDGAIADLEKSVAADNNPAALANLGLLYDSKTQDFLNELNKSKEKLSKGNTGDLEKKLAGEKDKLSAFEAELTKLNGNLKKDPKTATATKKKIAEVSSMKASIDENVAKMSKELADKKAGSGSADDLKKTVAAQEANYKTWLDKTLKVYNKVLTDDPNNYDVNFNLAVMYFNQAVETKKIVDAMDMKTYTAEGKEVEKKSCEQFNLAKPYFEKCNMLKAGDDVVIENLKNLNRIVEQCKK